MKMFNTNTLLLGLFLLAIFFFKIPNFYLIPFSSNPFFTSQAISRIIFIFLFILKLSLCIRIKKEIFSSHQKIIINLLIIFFILESLSVLSVINISSFLTRYKDIIIGLMSLFLFYFYRKSSNKIIIVFIGATLINLLYQSIIVFLPEIARSFINNFIYQNHANLVLADIDRGRIYIDSYDEMIIPFLFISYVENIFTKFPSYFITLLIAIFSFLSNFRSRVLMLIISLFSSAFLLQKLNYKKIFFYVIALLITGFFIGLYQNVSGQTPFYNRLAFIDNTDITTVTSRINQVNLSLKMGRLTFFGTGLGNYYDNINDQKITTNLIQTSASIESYNAKLYAHNIFALTLAETGYVSLGILIVILVIFGKRDIFIIKNGGSLEKAIVISFWSLFSYGLFNPVVPVSYQILFWGLRGLLL